MDADDQIIGRHEVLHQFMPDNSIPDSEKVGPSKEDVEAKIRRYELVIKDGMSFMEIRNDGFYVRYDDFAERARSASTSTDREVKEVPDNSASETMTATSGDLRHVAWEREPTWEDCALRIAAGLCGETGHKNFEAYVVRVADALDTLRESVKGCNRDSEFTEGHCYECRYKINAAIARLLGTTNTEK